MLRTIIAAGAIAAAAPAIAVQSTTPAPAPMPTPTPTTVAPPADSPIRVEGNPVQQRLADKSVPTVVATRGDIELAVNTEWSNFDSDRDNLLDEMEFAWFMKKVRETAGNTAETTEEVGRLNAATFVEADVDKDKMVSRAEMVALLMGPSA